MRYLSTHRFGASLDGASPHIGILLLGGSRVSFQVLNGLAWAGTMAKTTNTTRPSARRDSVMEVFPLAGLGDARTGVYCGGAGGRMPEEISPQRHKDHKE